MQEHWMAQYEGSMRAARYLLEQVLQVYREEKRLIQDGAWDNLISKQKLIAAKKSELFHYIQMAELSLQKLVGINNGMSQELYYKREEILKLKQEMVRSL